MRAASLRRTTLGWMTALLAGIGLAAMVAAYALARIEAADFLDGQLRQVALNAGPGLPDADAPPAADRDPEDQLAVTIWKDGQVLRGDRGVDVRHPGRTGYANIVMGGEPLAHLHDRQRHHDGPGRPARRREGRIRAQCGARRRGPLAAPRPAVVDRRRLGDEPGARAARRLGA
ncbi:hypothetical protein ACRAWG_18485 [Methylobacterium sp. P31]